eukprot:8786633-Heterocapsa_arctica.AAC.1
MRHSVRMGVVAQAVQRTDLGQGGDHAPRFPQQVAPLIGEPIAAAIELGLVGQHIAQALHHVELPPEAVSRPLEARRHSPCCSSRHVA